MLQGIEYGKTYPLNEKGIVLVLVLLLVAVLVLLGSTAVIISTTDMKISANYKTGNEAFYAAEAGSEEMRSRLKTSQPVSVIINDPAYPNPKWTAYILTSGLSTSDDPDSAAYSTAGYTNYVPHSSSQTSTAAQSNTLQTATPLLSYWVKVKHKTEYDAELQGHTTGTPHYADLDGSATGGHTLTNPGNIIYYGFRNPSSTNLEYFTSSTTPSRSFANPVEVIRSRGKSGSGGSARLIEVEVRRPLSTSVPAAVYGDTIAGGGTVVVDGRDNTLCSTDQLPAVAYVTEQELCGSGGAITCYPTGQQTVQVASLPLAERVEALRTSATNFLTQADEKPGITIGGPTDYRVVYIDATVLTPDQQFDFQDLNGYGILAVKGNVYFSGNLNWHGLIIASGQTDFYGGGFDIKNITGAVLSNTTATLQGKVNVKYDSCEINRANQSVTPVISIWNEKTGS